MKSRNIQRAAEDLLHARNSIAFTGAGVSVESGIPDFRSDTGLWSKYNPEDYATIDAFRDDPKRVWRMLAEMMSLVRDARPNPTHFGLVDLEKINKLQTIITQNVDGLHQAAGSQNVIELHGSHATVSCLSCGCATPSNSLSPVELPPTCPDCGSIMKPDVVLFGEAMPWEAYTKAMDTARTCDLVLVIGTSAVVYPAADIPITAKESSATLIEINLEATTLTREVSDYLIEGPSGVVVPRVVEAVKHLMKGEE